MKCSIGVSSVPKWIVVQIMSQSQQHATTCKPKRVMRLLCRNKAAAAYYSMPRSRCAPAHALEIAYIAVS